MTRLISCLLVVLACACGSSDDDDTNLGVDAAAGIDAAAGAFGSQCTTVTDQSTECTGGVCSNSFNMIPYPVCTQRCTVLGGTDPSCPAGAMGQKCNMQGYCRP